MALFAPGEAVRQPAVAGQFYPADAEALASTVADCLSGVRRDDLAGDGRLPKAIIAPHAGYIYSGAIAGTAYAPYMGRGDNIRRVVLLGPSHRVPFRGFAVSGAAAFLTPLGRIPVDAGAIETLTALPGVRQLEDAHVMEHSLEVHLPFVQTVFPNAALVPIVVGEADAKEVDAVLGALWGGPETVIIVSSDLSHYEDYTTAQGLDAEASRSIEMLRPDLLRDEQACGRRPIRGLLARARALDFRATTVDLRNSGDTAGSRDRVVGYGAYVLEDAQSASLPGHCRQALREIAMMAIRTGIEGGVAPAVNAAEYPRPLQAHRASFVTLTLDGSLRGCIGSLSPRTPLVADVATNAFKAATKDPRFPAVTTAEAERLEVGISILSTARTIAFDSEDTLARSLVPGIDGVILAAGEKRGLFLPQVWRSLPKPQRFLAQLKDKAGIGGGPLPGDVKAYRFSTETF